MCVCVLVGLGAVLVWCICISLWGPGSEGVDGSCQWHKNIPVLGCVYVCVCDT